ncbi:hypothetical protein BMF94_2842 [Rhodotorula taiwanensis]|uniref:Zinc finger GRF-type domain-containing protein n=1 Tax=Rhodotorula taiwanensis TaxID=741276 RepID=A0A2S5BB86_9BASI|nr:hypothetical protein BMF94_2842 [Rhodotorula taiwanensis]
MDGELPRLDLTGRPLRRRVSSYARYGCIGPGGAIYCYHDTWPRRPAALQRCTNDINGNFGRYYWVCSHPTEDCRSFAWDDYIRPGQNRFHGGANFLGGPAHHERDNRNDHYAAHLFGGDGGDGGGGGGRALHEAGGGDRLDGQVVVEQGGSPAREGTRRHWQDHSPVKPKPYDKPKPVARNAPPTPSGSSPAGSPGKGKDWHSTPKKRGGGPPRGEPRDSSSSGIEAVLDYCDSLERAGVRPDNEYELSRLLNELLDAA